MNNPQISDLFPQMAFNWQTAEQIIATRFPTDTTTRVVGDKFITKDGTENHILSTMSLMWEGISNIVGRYQNGQWSFIKFSETDNLDEVKAFMSLLTENVSKEDIKPLILRNTAFMQIKVAETYYYMVEPVGCGCCMAKMNHEPKLPDYPRNPVSIPV